MEELMRNKNGLNIKIVQDEVLISALSICCHAAIHHLSDWYCASCRACIKESKLILVGSSQYVLNTQKTAASLKDWLSYWSGYSVEELEVEVSF